MENQHQERNTSTCKGNCFLNAFSGKQAFFAGVIFGVLVLCTIALVVVLATGSTLGKNCGSNGAVIADNKAGDTIPNNQQLPEPDGSKIDKVSKKDHVTGNKDGKTVIVTYSDIQCPFCARFHNTTKELIEKNKDVKVIYRHFPLTSIHPEAENAAVAAECIASLGGNDAFWSFLDKAYADQSKLGKDFYAQVASELKINKDKFASCIADEDVLSNVRKQAEGGAKAGVSGTPMSFVNYKEVIAGAYPLESVEEIINKK